MCGIVGAVDLEGRRVFPAATLRRMVDALVRRGPDDVGTHVEAGLAMAVRRLALCDVAGGAQPMSAPDQSLRVCVNGELFRHPEERARLRGLGAVFRTQSDTEVWLHGWGHEGESFLERAEGQFAVAIWSGVERTLWLARDRFGICPLFLAEADGWLLWGSTARALLASGLLTPRADLRGLDHQLTFLGSSPVRSAFEGIVPLGAGELLRVTPGVSPPRRRCFAQLHFPAAGQEVRPVRRADLTRVVDALENELRGAVSRRLAADGPVALYLSGGVDSSLLAAMAASHGAGKESAAFSVSLAGLGRDEGAHARSCAQRLGLRHVVVEMTPAAVSRLFPEVVEAAETPILDHADACLLALSREVNAQGYKAVLTGEGADEAFAGYPWMKAHRWLSRFGAWAPRVARWGLGRLAGGPEHAALRRGHPLEGCAQAALLDLTGRARARFYSRSMRQALNGWLPSDDHAWALPRAHPVHQSLFAEYQLLLRGHLLADKGDRMAMASSVEPRFPYLDERVVELAATLHPDLKLRGLSDKWVLRQVAARWLPRAVARRTKHMFRADPIIHAEGRPAWVDQLLSEESLRRTGYFDGARVHGALSRAGSPSLTRGLDEAGLSGVVSTQLWHHLFLGGGLCELPRALSP